MEKQLPKNWVLPPFTEIFDINGGTQPPKAVFIDEPKEGYIRLLQIRDFGKKPVPTYIPNTGKLMTCKKDDILIARYGASIGRIVTGMEGSYNVALAKVGVPENMNKNFVKWLLKSNLFQEPILSIQRTAQNGFNKTDLAAIYVPLPPLPEQQRIVAKLDTLFAQLETIKTSMANIPLLLKDFRQQVLTQAVTGKLTEEYRKGKKLNEWQECPLSDFSEARLGKMLDNAKNSGELVSYLGNINVRWSQIDFSDLKQMKVELKELHKYELLKGDILVCEGGEPGRAAIWKYNRNDVIFQKALHRIRLNENVLPDFFLYNLKIDSQNNKLEQLFTGTTIKHLTGRSFSTYTILIPDTKEQQEIVRRVENLFAKADAIEQQYKTLKASIDSLPQALLHKAFKGELTEQLASDGDAMELLEEIKVLKAATGKAFKSKTNKIAIKKVKPCSETEEVLGMVAEEHYKK